MKKKKALLAVLLFCMAMSYNKAGAQEVGNWSGLKSALESGAEASLKGNIQAENNFIEVGDYESDIYTPNHKLELNTHTITGTDFGSAGFFVHEGINISNGTFKSFTNKGTNTQNFDMSTQMLGGVIYNEFADSTINKVTFDTNKAAFGGAVATLGIEEGEDKAESKITITDSNFTKNEATSVGGAIFNMAVKLTNYDEETGKGDFELITNDSNTVINIAAKESDVTFNENKATTAGGAIFNLETVNIEAEGEHKVKFETESDSIYNAGTLNIKKGETVVNSSITDEKIQLNLNGQQFDIGNSGVTNIEEDGILTLCENATITQKEINVKGALEAKESGLITGALNIASSGTADVKADKLTSEVTNDGDLALWGGELKQNIKGNGTTGILGNVTNNAKITQKTLVIEKEGDAENGIFTTNLDNINIADKKIHNYGTLILTGGTNEYEISSTDDENNPKEGGLTKIQGDVTNNALISQKVEISSGNLTSSADNIKGEVENKGTYNITGGTIAQVISGNGTVNINGDVISNVQNTLNGTVNIEKGAKLSMGESGNLFDSASALNAKNGSTISLINEKTDSSVLQNLNVALEDSVNIEVDWNDKLASTTEKVQGTIKLSKIDLTKKSDTEYEISNVLKDKISLADDVELVLGENKDNFLSYDSSDGKLKSKEINSVESAVKEVSGGIGSGVYQMSSDEKASESLGTLKSGNLTVNGGGNTLQGNNQEGAKVESGATLNLADIEVSGFANGTAVENEGNVNLSNVTLNDKITGNGTTGIVGDTTLNSTIEGNKLNLSKGTLTLGQSADISKAESFTAEGGALSLQNASIQDTNLGNLTLNQDMNLMLDGNFAEETMDTISANKFSDNGHKINISNINILEPTTAQTFSISPIAENTDEAVKSQLAGAIQYTGGEMVYSPIYKYNATYDPDSAMLNFERGGSGYDNVNPSIMAAPVAAQLGGYLNQLNSYDEAFRNMDMYMLMTKSQRQAMKYRNKYAAADSNLVFDPTNTPYDNTSAWLRPYATFENVKLKNGPKVSNVAWGSFFGADSELMELGNGWDGMFGVYLGYNGSHQAYDGISIYQNGATLGLVGMAYKDNFFAGLTANVGSNVASADTMYGNDDFTLLMSGIAAKTGYNWELADGKFIIQPSYMMSYSFVNTFDYTNAAGVRINSDPLNAIQFEPGLKFIGNLNNGWQPYMGVSVVWNVMDKTQFKASDATLPELSVKPFVKYGIGIRKTWGERLTGFFQTFFTSGGRNGVGLQAGVRWTLGSSQPKHANSTDEKKYIKANSDYKNNII